jgi:hypothetical protein
MVMSLIFLVCLFSRESELGSHGEVTDDSGIYGNVSHIYCLQITYSQRPLALLNIDKYNNIVNNTKEYKLIKRKDKTRQ